jgi:hypothetical protein
VGAQEGIEPGLLLLIWIFIAPIALYIYQSGQNTVMQAQTGGGAPAQVPPPAEQPAQPAQPEGAPPPPPPQGS